MAQRLRDSVQNINWTPEPMRPELLHFFNLPSIGSLAQRYENFDFVPSNVHFEAISSLPERMLIRTHQPSLEMKNPSEMVLTYQRSRKASSCKHADPSTFSGACHWSSAMVSMEGNEKEEGLKGNDLKTPHGDLDPSGTEIGSPPPLFLSQKAAKRKRSATPLFPEKIPEFANRRRVNNARSKQIGWINTGDIMPSATVAHASLSKGLVLSHKISLNIESISDIPYKLHRRIHSNGEDAPMEVGGSSKSARLAQPGDGKKKISVSLLSDEIEDDFIKMRGEMPLRKPNKRPKNTQSQLDVSISTFLEN